MLPYDITLSMLVYLFLSKVATFTQSNSLPLYFHMCVSVSQPVKNIDIAVFTSISVFAGIAVFARLRHLNVITSINIVTFD